MGRRQVLSTMGVRSGGRRGRPAVAASALLVLSHLLTPAAHGQKVAISGADAAADVRELQRLLEVESSYARLADQSWRSRLESLATRVESEPVVQVHTLRLLLADVLGDLGDRHSGIRPARTRGRTAAPPIRYGELPVALARLGERLLVLRPVGERFQPLDAEYPFLAAIDGVPIREAIAAWTPENRAAPPLSSLANGARSLRRLGALRSLRVGDEVQLTLAGAGDEASASRRDVSVELVEEGPLHTDGSTLWSVYRDAMREERLEALARRLGERIGYIAIPDMVSLERTPAMARSLRSAMESMRDLAALVLDVRGNGGGTREILWLLAPYLVPRDVAPWVANVAYLRSDQQLDEELESLTSRYLLPQGSGRFDDRDRAVMQRFLESFSPRRPVPSDRFSAPYVMLLHSGPEPFDGRVYVLANEQTFSAASVFVAALEGLPNVTLAGVRTDGSSGRSRRHQLPNSQLEVRLSTMTSYQRDGTTLDGNGTVPHLEIDVTLEQRLTGRDLQLEALVAEIERRLASSAP